MSDDNDHARHGRAIDRRTVLKTTAAAAAAGVGTAAGIPSALAHQGRHFVVEQGDRCIPITPLARDERLERFYDYRVAHSHTSTGIERSDVSSLFLYQGPQGTSLVVIHDAPGAHTSDTGGGAASFTFTGLPTGSGSWVVRDGEGGDFAGATDTSPNWSWAERHTDGGGWRGGLDGDFTVTIDPAFNSDAPRDPLTPGTIDEWHVLSGDPASPDRYQLALDEPVTIRTGRCVIPVEIDVKPMEEPDPINPHRAGGTIPVAVLDTDAYDVGRIDPASLRFGAPDVVDAGGGAAPAHGGHWEDVDGDGDTDLVAHFPAADAGFDGDESEGKIVGETANGQPIAGTDSVTLVGGNGGGGPP